MRQQAEAMIGRALNAGINYIDTAYPYHKGESEPFLGRALKNIRETAFIWQQNCRYGW